ncbi:Ppx/GppA phosphatase family protein [Brevibacillus dissolubilis]|uniref:Ppx/GppA phosphatase family protein n=1 Tax=Brevibacillus dissolubilis TaxID=1844116 RepID=UPI0011165431|nr:Ppx/GppA phosphatase family protein [Brevibacillus dissolubilis]
MEKIAIIDMGSNTIRMVIFEINQDSYHLVDDTKETVRLSESMGPERILKPASVKRALSTLKRFMKLCRSRQVTTIVPVTTAAVRIAENQQDFLNTVEAETGLRFRVLSGHEEGYYGLVGVLNGFSLQDGFTLDIGGGSSEVTLFRSRKLSDSVSMPFGALTLTESYRDPEQDGRVSIYDVRQYLRSAFLNQPWISANHGLPLIGLGGTVRNIARIHRNLIGYPIEIAHNYEMSKTQVDETINYIASLSYKELQQLPGLSKERADIILAGGLIIQSLMEACKAPQLLISGNGIREGLFYEYYQQRYPQKLAADVTMSEVENLMHYYKVDHSHAHHVAHLSLRLFDDLSPRHKMGESERRLLHFASLLHDVGVTVSFYEWQKHTYYVLLHSKIPGLTHRERLLVALIAASKNKKKIREWSAPYQMLLKPEDEELVLRLTIILLMARALDRSLSMDVQDVTCKLSGKETKIIMHTVTPDIELELKEARELLEKFDKSFGGRFEISAKVVEKVMDKP